MKLTTKREDLVSKLSIVSRAVSTRAATQALSGVLLTAKEGRVTLAATDLDLGLETTLDANVENEGATLLPGRLFAEVARSLADPTVEIESREAEHDVEIRSGGSSFHLRVLPVEDFPKLPQPEDEPGLRIPAAALEESIELVARAASRDDMRPVLTGVFVTATGREMTMVATDSYRLAVKRTELESDLGGELEANIPARALRELGRILSSEGAGETTISLLTNQAVFVAGSIILSTRLIDGQFPNFRQLLPESYEHDVRLPRSDFLDVVRRVSQLAQRNAPLRLSFRAGELTVAAETPEVGDARETMPAAFEGEELEIGFNPEFLREGIESVSGDEVLLRLISPLRPGLLEPVEGDEFRYLVMPIRLNV
ncbi:MAG: DNA polymerase III subunit beta [Actinobacteria bacterium]|nr:MAG: DNA polymerase III subunit beta [Actinomycetota bacterium]